VTQVVYNGVAILSRHPMETPFRLLKPSSDGVWKRLFQLT